MKKIKLNLLLLTGAATIAFTSALYGQEIEAQSEATEAASPLNNPELFARELLGSVYFETMEATTGTMPESQWNELFLHARQLAESIFAARQMADDEAATAYAQAAYAKYETAIDAGLSPEQKAARTAKRAGLDAWHNEKVNFVRSQGATLFQQARANGGTITVEQK